MNATPRAELKCTTGIYIDVTPSTTACTNLPSSEDKYSAITGVSGTNHHADGTALSSVGSATQ
jgi:hypothetical protein